MDIHVNNESILRGAAYDGNLGLVKYLVSLEANLNENDEYTLSWSAYNGHLEMVKYLLEKGAEPNILKRTSMNAKIREYIEEKLIKEKLDKD